MSKLIVQTTGINFSFGGQKTLHDVNLHVEQGSIYGFLGPNGAGKTTTLRLLLGLLKKQQGEIQVFGKDLQPNRMEILRKIGSLIEQPSLYNHLTAKENLEIYRRIYGVPKERISEVLTLVGLGNTGAKKAKQFSLGMKQRLSIAVALLHRPELLVLDEPTNGLDPNGIIETRELIKRLNVEFGVTVLVSSHILAEIERMATHVGIIHKGAFLFQGPLSELHQLQSKKSYLQIETANNEAAMTVLGETLQVEKVNGHLLLPFKDKSETAWINRKLMAHNIDVYRLQPQQKDLEQLFIDITSN
jgi:ABC-2 type transport system ATP-binding protein